jgi:hypothetical protein
MQRKHDSFSLVLPKTHQNRGFNGWTHRIIDPNTSRVFGFDAVRGLDGLTREDDMRFMSLAIDTAQQTVMRDPTLTVGEKSRAFGAEAKRIVDEFHARNPGRVLLARLQSFVSLAGLWNSADTAARANGWYSAPLRGEQNGFWNSVQFDVRTAMAEPRFNQLRDFQEAMAVVARPTVGLLTSPVARRFNEWFWAYQLFRPLVAWLFMIGIVWALARRDWIVVVIGVIVLANLVGAAWVVMTPSNRFGAPFLPTMYVVAAYACHRLVCLRRQRST